MVKNNQFAHLFPNEALLALVGKKNKLVAQKVPPLSTPKKVSRLTPKALAAKRKRAVLLATLQDTEKATAYFKRLKGKK